MTEVKKFFARVFLLCLACFAIIFIATLKVHVQNPIWPLEHRTTLGALIAVVVVWVGFIFAAVFALINIWKAADIG